MITEFRVGCSKTINLGDYQSIRIEASVTVAVPEGEDLPTAKHLAQLELKSLLHETWQAQRKDPQK